jgi:hypothetical protein
MISGRTPGGIRSRTCCSSASCSMNLTVTRELNHVPSLWEAWSMTQPVQYKRLNIQWSDEVLSALLEGISEVYQFFHRLVAVATSYYAEQLFLACSCVFYRQGMEFRRCHRDGVNRTCSRKLSSICHLPTSFKRTRKINFVSSYWPVCARHFVSCAHNSHLSSELSPLSTVFSCDLFYDVVHTLDCITSVVYCVVINWKAFGRKGLGHKRSNIPEFAWGCWGIPRTTSDKVVCFPPETSNTSLVSGSHIRYLTWGYVHNHSHRMIFKIRVGEVHFSYSLFQCHELLMLKWFQNFSCLQKRHKEKI